MEPKSEDKKKKEFTAQTAANQFSDDFNLNFNKAEKGSDPYRPSPGQPHAVQYAINDAPAEKDTIGFKPFVSALSRLICHPKTETPVTIGIIGPWGAGKSSFMGQVKQTVSEIDREGKIFQIWFNAWRHDIHGNLWASLLQSIFTQIEMQAAKNPIQKYLMRLLGIFSQVNKLKLAIQLLLTVFIILIVFLYLRPMLLAEAKSNGNTLLQSLIKTAPTWVATLAALGFLYPSVSKFLVGLMKPIGVNLSSILNDRDFSQTVSSLDDFNDKFQSLLKLYIKKDGRLIVYIDDLDRCTPDNAAEVVETINVFLSSPSCIFILGIDRDKLALSIEAKYKQIIELELEQMQRLDIPWSSPGLREERRYGEKFLEKIIQLPISLPVPSRTETEKFTNSLLDIPSEADPKFDDKPTDSIEKAVQVELPEYMKEVLVKISGYHSRNPRLLKRFINTFRFVHFLYVMNREKFPEINELALPYWFFLYDRFRYEMETAYQGMISDESPATKVPLNKFFYKGLESSNGMRQFIESLPAEEKESEWIALFNSGRDVRSYYELTRFIHY
jgi:hypothetical protein